MGDNEVLTKRRATSEILKLGMPAIAEQFLLTAVIIVSTAIVSHLGPHELLAANWNGSIFNLFMGVFTGLALGTTVVISRNWGAEKKSTIPLIMIVSLVMAIVLGIGMLLTGYFILGKFFRLFYGGSDQITLEYATEYGRMILWGLPFAAGQAVLIGAIRGVGNNKVPLYLNSLLNVANAVFSYMLVNGVVFPRMGLMGAAWGVNIARVLGFLVSVWYVFFINKDLRAAVKKAHLWSVPISKRILHIGLPSILESLVTNGGFVILSMVLVVLGAAAQGGYNIGANSNSIIGAPANGLGIAMTVLISRYMGARQYDYADVLVKQAYKIGIIMVSVLGIGEFVFAEKIILLYTSDPEMMIPGIFSLRLFAAISLLVGISMVQAGILKGAGAAKYVAFTMFMGLWLGRVLCSWVLLHFTALGLTGLFIGISLDFGSRSSLYYFKIRSGDWKYIKA